MDPKLIESYLKQTEVVRSPRKTLSTFGATRIDYHLISPVEDMSNRTRLRHGNVVSLRPKIITAQAFIERFEGFGDESSQFGHWLNAAYQDLLRSLEYNFKNQGFETRVLSERPEVVAARIDSELAAKDDKDQAIIRCPDGAWSLAIMKFTLDESARSFPVHVRDLERRGLFQSDRRDSGRRRREVERLFEQAAQDRTALEALGRKLRDYGLFDEYEDRYLAFFK